jgi:hypothetical protein
LWPLRILFSLLPASKGHSPSSSSTPVTLITPLEDFCNKKLWVYFLLPIPSHPLYPGHHKHPCLQAPGNQVTSQNHPVYRSWLLEGTLKTPACRDGLRWVSSWRWNTPSNREIRIREFKVEPEGLVHVTQILLCLMSVSWFPLETKRLCRCRRISGPN